MVWKDTTKIGCAVNKKCTWDTYICQYSPPGNVVSADWSTQVRVAVKTQNFYVQLTATLTVPPVSVTAMGPEELSHPQGVDRFRCTQSLGLNPAEPRPVLRCHVAQHTA